MHLLNLHTLGNLCLQGIHISLEISYHILKNAERAGIQSSEPF